MSPSASPIQVLCLGNDPQLLSTRHLVLATRYDAVSAGSLEQLETLREKKDFRVIILCHTLTGPERGRSAAFVRQHWPDARILAIGKSEESGDRIFDAIIARLEGPSALLAAVDTLLGRDPLDDPSQRRSDDGSDQGALQ